MDGILGTAQRSKAWRVFFTLVLVLGLMPTLALPTTAIADEASVEDPGDTAALALVQAETQAIDDGVTYTEVDNVTAAETVEAQAEVARAEEKAEPVKTDSAVRVKITLVDAQQYDGQTIDEIFNDAVLTGTLYLGQSETVAALYDYGDENYYAAYVDTAYSTGAIDNTATDWAIAADNYDGEAIEGAYYDAETGIAYFPRTWIDNYDNTDGADLGYQGQVQLLYPYAQSGSETSDNIATSNVEITNTTTGAVLETAVTQSVFDSTTNIQIASPEQAGSIEASSITVTLDDAVTLDVDAPASDDELYTSTDTAVYNNETGILSIPTNTLGVSTMAISLASDDDLVAVQNDDIVIGLNDNITWAPASFKYVTIDDIGDQLNNYWTVWCYYSTAGKYGSISNYFATAEDATGPTNYTQDPDSGTTQVKASTAYGLSPFINGYAINNFAGPTEHSVSRHDIYLQQTGGGNQWDWSTSGLISYSQLMGGSDYLRGLDWSFTETISPRLYQANCVHISNTAAAGESAWCNSMAKITGLDSVNNTVTITFIRAQSSDSGQSCANTFKFKLAEAKGNIELQKASANPSVTDNNPCYTLAGIVYGVYADAACTNEVATLVLNSSGYAKSADIKAGTYYIKEKTANDSYSLSSTVYTTVVKGGQTTRVNGGTVKDEPLNDPGYLMLAKVDAQGHAHKYSDLPQGSATLAGAQYTVRYYANMEGSTSGNATRTWVYQTNDKGVIRFSSESAKSSGDNLYYSGGRVVYPRGTYTVEETKAPEGYLIHDELNEKLLANPIVITKEGDFQAQLSAIIGDYAEQEGTPSLYLAEDTENGGAGTIQKHDAENNTAQGDATLEGIEFTIYNASESYVYVNNKFYEPGDAIATMVTDASGHCDTDFNGNGEADDLPFGHYKVVETKTNAGMLISEGAARGQEFDISEDGQAISLDYTDSVLRGNVEVYKGDTETHEAYPLEAGDAKLDATFQIVNKSAKEVWVQGTKYAVGDVVYEGKATQNDDGSWSFKTPADLLPYGTYDIVESQNATGYNGTDKTLTFSIREQGTVTFGSATDTTGSIENQIVRTDVTWQKKSDTDGAKMAGIPFVIVSNTTGEAHVVVTDKNGIVNTKTTRGNANANDAAVSGLSSALTKDENGHYKLTGKVTVDEDALDASNGVWFGFTRAASITEANSALGALPYESTAGYSVLELPVMSNKDFQMIEDILLVDYEDDSKLLDWGTMDDVEPSISTTAYNGVTNDVTDHTFVADDEVKLVDRVTYEECIPGREYKMTGELHYADTGEAVTIDGKALAVTKTFKPASKAGYILMELDFDGTSLEAGRDVVFFETMTYAGGSVEHADKTDLYQTLTPKKPAVQTTAKATDGTKVVKLDKETTVVDTVGYKDVVVGYEYKLVAELMDKATGEAVLDASGNAVTAEATFTPEQSRDSIDVTLVFDGTKLDDGIDLVVYETLVKVKGGKTVADHKDINDEGQTVKVEKPRIGTTATDTADGDKYINSNSEVSITDAVAYSGLVPGREYTVSGTLMVKHTDHSYVASINGHEFGKGKEVSANASGTFFKFDTDKGYETLSKNIGGTWTHTTVTSATESSDGEKTAEIKDTETLQASDVEVKDNGTGEVTEEAATDANGKEITASTTFAPETANGSVDVVFAFDGSKLQGGTELVAFETLTRDDVELAVHADINDDAQKVIVENPEIQTTATDMLDGDNVIVADEEAAVNDTVSYEHLSTNTPYTLIGVLMDKATNLPLITGEKWESIEEKDLQAFWTDMLNALGTSEKKLANEYNDPFATTDVDYTAFQEVLAKNTAIADAIALKQLDFTADHADGNIDVELAFDGSRFIEAEEANDVVAYEFLVHDSKLVAVHADINDEGQTVSVEPSNIGTTLVDSTDQDHIALPSTTTKLVDTVSYENLIPGKEYTVTGKLMVKDTGKVLLSNDKEVTASTTFTPNKASGSVDVVFEFDSSALDGKSLVAFEYMEKDGIEVAVHEDIDDENQTVTIDKLGGATGKSYSKTGVDLMDYLWAVIAAGVVGVGCVGYGTYRIVKNRKKEEESDLFAA